MRSPFKNTHFKAHHKLISYSLMIILTILIFNLSLTYASKGDFEYYREVINYSDNFEDGIKNLTIWEEVVGGGTIVESNGNIRLRVGSGAGRPYISNKLNLNDSKDYYASITYNASMVGLPSNQGRLKINICNKTGGLVQNDLDGGVNSSCIVIQNLANNTGLSNVLKTFFLRINATSGNATLYNPDGSFNQTQNITRLDNYYITIASIRDTNNANFEIYVYNFLLEEELDLISSETFNITSFETQSETFEINLTYDYDRWDSTSMDLFYNGTSYSGTTSDTGDERIYSVALDVPLVTGNKTFNWRLGVTDLIGTEYFNFTLSNQTINVTLFDICNATLTTNTFNFTAFDEQDLTRIIPFDFFGTFEFWFGSGSVKRNLSLNVSSATEVRICIEPRPNYFIDATIDYDEAVGSNYTIRNYYFQNDLILPVQNLIPLYLLRSDKSTSFILKVQNDALLPLEDHLIFIERFYPGTGDFQTVQIAQTDENGQSIGFFETETAEYRFTIKFNGETLLQTEKRKIVPETSPFTLTFTIGQNLGSPWKLSEDLSFLDSVMFFNNTNMDLYRYLN